MATRNYVPRATGEGSIGTEKKHWGGAFFDKLAVKTLEVIGSGTENDGQPATVGWVKSNLQDILSSLLNKVGFRASFGESASYVSLGSMFAELKIVWGRVEQSTIVKEEENGVIWFTLPISFSDSNTYAVVTWDDNTSNEAPRVYKSFRKDSNTVLFKAVTRNADGTWDPTPKVWSSGYIAIGR